MAEVTEELVQKIHLLTSVAADKCRTAFEQSGGDIDRAVLLLAEAGEIKADTLGLDAVKVALKGGAMSSFLNGPHANLFLEMAAMAAKQPPSMPPPESEKWHHPELGTFEFVGYQWQRTMRGGSKVFSFKPVYSSKVRDTFRLAFASTDPKMPPSQEEIALAQKIIGGLETIGGLVSRALWDEFIGDRKSRVWWGRNLMDVERMVADQAGVKIPLNEARDVLKALNLSEVVIRRETQVFAELSFYAAFEDEHGVGVLTDGERILGVGFENDVVADEAPPQSTASVEDVLEKLRQAYENKDQGEGKSGSLQG